MPDYIYLLENRLSADQRNALKQVREAAREAGMIVFLTGDAVRDLTSGHAVRDLEVAVHGNALKLKKAVEKLGGKLWGEDETTKSLYLCFPGTVRVDLISTHSVEYPKPGKGVIHLASIQEDLRRRDFTVNAMAISLNEGSFGLLMDPLNGAADIEARSLRLVSNYGFLEEPALLIRATRYAARLGWDLDQRTQTRYENAVAEGVIEHLSDTERSAELEQIGHEEDGLKVLQALETAGWMKVLFPAWTVAKADVEKLAALHDLVVELLMQGVHADVSAAQMQLLTAKLSSKDLGALKKLMLRPGFVEEWNSLDSLAAKFAKVLLSRENATPSASYKLFTTYDPEAVLWLGFTSKDAAVKERFNQFLKVWPEAKTRIPHALMQEMRITPELPGYADLIHAIFLQLIDGKLLTPEETRAFLEPHSPPAPPPQVTIKRTRAKRGAEPKVKERSFDDDEEGDDDLEDDDEIEDIVVEDEEIDLGIPIPKGDLEGDLDEEADAEEGEEDADDEDEPPTPPKGKKGTKAAPAPAPVAGKAAAKAASKTVPVKAGKSEPAAAVKPEAKHVPASKAPATPAPKAPPAKTKPEPVKQAKATPPKPVAKATAKPPAKVAAKPAKPTPKPKAQAKVPAKAPAKTAAKKPAPAKAKVVAKPAKPTKPTKPVKKPAAKPAKKR